MSADVLSLYTTFGGFREYEFDEELFWSLWPWEWLKERNQEEKDRTKDDLLSSQWSRKRDQNGKTEGVLFCDHSIEVVTWELHYETPLHSSVWSTYGVETAPTLQMFLEQYLEDPEQLL